MSIPTSKHPANTNQIAQITTKTQHTALQVHNFKQVVYNLNQARKREN